MMWQNHLLELPQTGLGQCTIVMTQWQWLETLDVSQLIIVTFPHVFKCPVWSNALRKIMIHKSKSINQKPLCVTNINGNDNIYGNGFLQIYVCCKINIIGISQIDPCVSVPTVWGQRWASCIAQSCVPDRLLTISSTENELCWLIRHAQIGFSFMRSPSKDGCTLGVTGRGRVSLWLSSLEPQKQD